MPTIVLFINLTLLDSGLEEDLEYSLRDQAASMELQNLVLRVSRRGTCFIGSLL